MRNSRKSNRIPFLFFFCFLFFDNSSSTFCSRSLVEVVDLIHIDNLPPFFCHEVSYDRSDESDESIGFDRHSKISKGDDLVSTDNLIVDETIDRREIESAGYHDREEHHKKDVESFFHKRK